MGSGWENLKIQLALKGLKCFVIINYLYYNSFYSSKGVFTWYRIESQSGINLLRFLHFPSCNSAIWTYSVYMTQEQKWSHSGSSSHLFSLRIETFIPVRDPWNHINGDQSSFRNETGSRPGQRMRSLGFLWFSAAHLQALYLVRPRLVWVSSETLSCKHGTKCCFSFRIKLTPVV